MIVLVLLFAGGAALVTAGIVQGRPATAILGGAVLAFLVWGLFVGDRGDNDNDVGEA
ncbi:hypothetical protein AB0J55_12225 [Amycolatopsis sp. NPDC049688]|uniref:hypothetical protein n=1 Tax=Amycolatopsis sp. NPDC049688 TaxID=3154733 RepID=UPI00344A5D77